MSKCIKQTFKEMTGFRRVAQIEKSSPDSPRLEMIKFIKRSDQEMIGFNGVSQIVKSSPV